MNCVLRTTEQLNIRKVFLMFCKLSVYINELLKVLEQSAAPSLTLLESEVKRLFADDLVLLSPTKEGLRSTYIFCIDSVRPCIDGP